MSSVGPTRNLFIAGFKSDMTDAALRQLFSGFGTIESAKVMLDIHTGVSRGFAFVLYAQLADAIAAREALNGSVQMTASPDKATIADQFKLTVEFAKHDAYNVVTRNVKVYCRNIPTTATENSVAELMEQWIGKGTVVTVAIMPDSNRSPAMFGARPGGAQPVVKPSGNVAFIEFRTADEAQLAVDTTYNKRIDGPGSVGPLMTKFAETAEVRTERKKRQPNAAANTSPGGAAGASRAVSSQPPSPPIPSVQQQLQHQHQQQHAMMQPYPIMMMNAPPGYPPQPYFVQMMPNAGSLPMLPMMVPTAMMMPPSDSFQRLSNPPPQQAVYAPQPHRQ